MKLKILTFIVTLVMLFTVNVFAWTNEKNDDVWIYEARVVRVLDGDTIAVEIDMGLNIIYRDKIRFLDYDAPETWRPKSPEEKLLGQEATKFLKKLIINRTIILHIPIKKHKDKYGRILARVYLGKIDVIDTMIEKGFTKDKIQVKKEK